MIKIGFIGQGWIGRNYADDFENRGYEVVRYAQEPPYDQNKEKIAECDIVFIAVPTPTRLEEFDLSIVRQVVKLVGKDKIAVVKSTILPGTTEILQKENPDIFIFHSPEFLVQTNAAFDAAHPTRNVIGLPVENDEYKEKAAFILSLLPSSPHNMICRAREAELIKYGANGLLYVKVVFANLLYDLAQKNQADWEVVKDGIGYDPRIGQSHLNPVYQNGRGAGGGCFIKDFEALHGLYKKLCPQDQEGLALFQSLVNKNNKLLKDTNKDLELLRQVYGEKPFK